MTTDLARKIAEHLHAHEGASAAWNIEEVPAGYAQQTHAIAHGGMLEAK